MAFRALIVLALSACTTEPLVALRERAPDDASAATVTGAWTPNASTTSADLTADGTIDWVHLGLAGDRNENRKAGVTASPHPISVDVVGTTPRRHYNDRPPAFAWNDGQPQPSADTNQGVFVAGIDNGFVLRVRGDGGLRTLRVWVGIWAATATLRASVDEGSEPVYTDTRAAEAAVGQDFVYTLTFTGTSLTVTWIVREQTHSDGNASFQAAALR